MSVRVTETEGRVALFSAKKNVQAIALGAVTLRLRGKADGEIQVVADERPLATVHELRGYSRKVPCA